ncbi:hypothetical protein Trco_008341 [Trichoderma cornu-damae]|uniref:C2H2-type domain-containing protein n=1 Tax=Trichoderma cornu-damae TaxID=654480 RepID=A0A9P8QE00_9HYPO|nr:hypothetical protein Trco_008341 [Trichoderma cornu-damae]
MDMPDNISWFQADGNYALPMDYEQMDNWTSESDNLLLLGPSTLLLDPSTLPVIDPLLEQSFFPKLESEPQSGWGDDLQSIDFPTDLDGDSSPDATSPSTQMDGGYAEPCLRAAAIDEWIGIHPTPIDLQNEVTNGRTASSPAGSINDPSSEVDDHGNYNNGFRWCCKRWHAKKGGSFTKHRQRHNPHLPCEASPLLCPARFSEKKDRHNHYRAAHKKWAEANNIPDTSCVCDFCGTTFCRGDFKTRHLKKCRKRLEQKLKDRA